MKRNVYNLPIICSIILIFFHWAVLYPIAVAINGHPPVPLMLLELPGIIAMMLFAKLFYPLHISSEKVVLIENIISVSFTTIYYGTIGFMFGVLLNKNRKTSKD